MWAHQKYELCAEAQICSPAGTEAGLTLPALVDRLSFVAPCGETSESVVVNVRGFIGRRRAVSKKLVFLDLLDGPLSAPPKANGVCIEVMCKFPRLTVEEVQTVSRSAGVLDFVCVTGVVERAPLPLAPLPAEGSTGAKQGRPGGALTLHATSVEVLASHTRAEECPLLPDYSGPPVAEVTVANLRALAKQVSDQAAFVTLSRSCVPACAVTGPSIVPSAPAASSLAPDTSTSSPALPPVCLGWLRGSCPSPCPRSLRHSFASPDEETRLRARQEARCARLAAEESENDPFRGAVIVKGSRAAAVLRALDAAVAQGGTDVEESDSEITPPPSKRPAASPSVCRLPKPLRGAVFALWLLHAGPGLRSGQRALGVNTVGSALKATRDAVSTEAVDSEQDSDCEGGPKPTLEPRVAAPAPVAAMFPTWLTGKPPVVDVAGGRGDLSFALLARGVVSTVVDPRVADPKVAAAAAQAALTTAALAAAPANAAGIASNAAAEWVLSQVVEPFYLADILIGAARALVWASTRVKDGGVPVELQPLLDAADTAAAATSDCTPPATVDVAPAAAAQAWEYLSARQPAVAAAVQALVAAADVEGDTKTVLARIGRVALTVLRSPLIVGLHPDQPTEDALDAAWLLGKPCAVVPCCVFPSLSPNRRGANGDAVVTYPQFADYLKGKFGGGVVQEAFLPLEGRNRVIYLPQQL